MTARRKIVKRETAEDELVERLARLALFEGMAADEVREIVRRIGGGIRRFARRETVVREGVEAKWVVPVLRGRLEVHESGADGESHLVRIIETGGLFGSTLVTSNLGSYPGRAVAAVASEVVFFETVQIRALWREARHPRFFENLYSLVSGEVLDCWRKVSIFACRKTDDRFMLYLRWRAAETGETEIRIPFPTTEACAQFLGVTRTSLSLAIKRLIARGEIVRTGHGRYVIV